MSLFGGSGKPPEIKPHDQPVRPPSPAAPATSGGGARPSAPPVTSSGPCLIGTKTVVKGEITGEEDVLIEGQLEGQVRITRDLRIGPTGSVKATIEASSVVISGELIGDCAATLRVEIQASGKLTGNIRAPKIVIAEGAMFKGNSDMSPRK